MIGTILTSSLIAGLVGAAVAIWTTQKRINIENITQERQAWREKVRDKALAVHDALVARDKPTLDRLRSEFTAILNPEDQDDKDIIDCISLPDEGKELERAEEFAKRISFLMKHDWERVKLEVGPAMMRLRYVRNWLKKHTKLFYEPARGKYKKNS